MFLGVWVGVKQKHFSVITRRKSRVSESEVKRGVLNFQFHFQQKKKRKNLENVNGYSYNLIKTLITCKQSLHSVLHALIKFCCE